jgi:phosphotransacetylase
LFALYELVKSSKSDTRSLSTVINLFEPKIKKSLHLTSHKNKEDLLQELNYKLVKIIKSYDVDSTPGFWKMREIIYEKEGQEKEWK